MTEPLYQCADCGLHYRDPARADACYHHCTTYGACNLDITRESEERRAARPRLDADRQL